MGTATVGLLYVVGRRFWSDRAGLAAATMLATLPLHIRHSQYITVDVAGGLMTLLAIGAALRLLEHRDLRSYTLAGLAAGLAAGTKYNAAAVVLIIGVMHVLRWGRASLRQLWRLP
jgi:4-amino-4-deoxy-L-arabinose transferase-like glycosyltransferase